MDTFVFALNAVLPLVLLIAIGYFIKSIKLVDGSFFKQANKLCFKIFLPTTLFLNIYNIKDIKDINWGAPLFAIGALVAVFLLGLVVCLIFIKDNGQKGAVWQCIFRSNYAILGIPLAGLVFGDEGTAVASVISAFIIPLFNVFAVIALSVFRSDGKKPDFKKVFIDICKNPLIHGVLLGVACLGVRAIFVALGWSFRISSCGFLFKTISYLSQLTTPLALIVLGGQFEFKALAKAKKPIIIATLLRLIIVPALVLICACLLFGFRGAPVVAFITAFGSPVAVSSAIMAQEMNADGELAGSLVVSTTVGSVLSLTLIIAIVKAVGLI